MNWGTYRLPNIIYILRQTHGTLNLSGHRKHFATAFRVKRVVIIYKKNIGFLVYLYWTLSISNAENQLNHEVAKASSDNFHNWRCDLFKKS